MDTSSVTSKDETLTDAEISSGHSMTGSMGAHSRDQASSEKLESRGEPGSYLVSQRMPDNLLLYNGCTVLYGILF